MPFDSMLVSAAVVIMFLVFAGVLAWGQRQSELAGQRTDDSQPKRRSF
jgi:hypothetical protein